MDTSFIMQINPGKSLNPNEAQTPDRSSYSKVNVAVVSEKPIEQTDLIEKVDQVR